MTRTLPSAAQKYSDRNPLFKTVTAVLLLIVGALIGLSCEKLIYSPNGQNLVDIALPADTLYTSFVYGCQDTLTLFGQSRIEYSRNLSEKPFVRALLYLDSTLVSQADKEQPLAFDTQPFPDGLHALSMRLQVRTLSGSLTDLAHREYYDTTITAPVYIRNSVPENPIELVSIGPHEGSLRISWTPYAIPNFQGYEVQKEVRVNGQWYDWHLLGAFDKAGDTECYDDEFTGGLARYRIWLKAANQRVCAIDMEHEDPFLTFSLVAPVSANAVKLSWPRTPYYNNFESYMVRRRLEGDYYADVVDHWLDTPDDTTYTAGNLLFGEMYEFELQLRPFPENFREWYPRTTVLSGNQCKPVSQVYYRADRNAIVISGPGGSQELDAQSHDLLWEGSDAVILSPDGRSAYAATEKESLWFTALDRLNSDTYGEETRLAIKAITGRDHQVSMDLSQCYLNDNQIFFFQSAGYGVPHFYAADLKTKTLLDSIHAGSHCSAASLDGGGDYIRVDNGYWHFDGAKFSKVADVPAGDCFAFQAENGRFVTTQGNRLVVRAMGTASLLKQFAIEHDLSSPTVDNLHNWVGGLCAGLGLYRIYDLDTGQCIKELNVSEREGKAWYFLCGGLLFAAAGAFTQIAI